MANSRLLNRIRKAKRKQADKLRVNRQKNYEDIEREKILTGGLDDQELFEYIARLNYVLDLQIPNAWAPGEKGFHASQVDAFKSGLATIWNAQFPPPAGAGIPREWVIGELRKTADELAWGGKNYASMLVVDFVQKHKDSTGPIHWPDNQ
jgi:hypothetical protein